ncbi:MAG TPA: DUF6526 family protein [Candidatus Angelobacter sp.]|nr:DUF6526 family protein [Candidatus Angelobacter sp.]
MENTTQTFANHAKIDPPFHYVLLPILTINLIAAIYNVVRHPGVGTAWVLVLSLAAAVAMFRLRIYPLRVQDRVIRLEERLRLMTVLQEPLRSRIGELTDGQLVGLRFASDAELPALVQRALSEKLDRAAIKKAVANWRPDYSRI